MSANFYQQNFASGSDSPIAPPVPIKRGRGRPPKNRNLIAQQQAQHQPPPPSTPQPRTSHITSPRLRTAPAAGIYHSSSSPYQPLPPSAYGQGGIGPGTPDQNVMYQPLPTMFARPPFSASYPASPVPSFPPMPTFQHQQEFQQQQSQANIRQSQQLSSANGHVANPARLVSSSSSSSTVSDAAIITSAGGTIGAGLGQAVGNAGASAASRTRRKADTADPELKVPASTDLGWMSEPRDIATAQQVYSTIVDYVRNYTDVTGRRLSVPLEDCPDPEVDPDYYLKVEKPTSLSAIQQRIVDGEYANAIDFEMDMLLLFENARRLYAFGTQLYGDVVVLQRLYHQLTRSRSSDRKGVTAASVLAAADEADSSKNFSSIPFGPGYASAGSDGDLTTRISSKSKKYYEHLNFKGKAFRVGDWVHLVNPSDSSKPIVAQIFKVMRREDDDLDQGWVTVCWYFRPEQTFHPASKKFFKNEVVKTGYFADHQIEDILEKIMVMFYTKYIRGRPKADYWDPKSPLYVTESRYNEQQRVFHKIKSWASCVPEEIRKVETPMNFFEKTISPPIKEDSPFLRGIIGPGALREDDPMTGGLSEYPDLFKDSVDDTRFKKKSRLEAGGSEKARSAGEAFTSLASQIASRVSPEQYFRLQQLLSDPSAAHLDMTRLSYELDGVDENLLSELRNAAIAAGVTAAGLAKVASSNFADTIADDAQPLQSGETEPTSMTGLVDLVNSQRGEGHYAELPSETRDLFADQPGGTVTWYPAPPLDGPVQHHFDKTGPYAQQALHGRHHSLDYLYRQVSRPQSISSEPSESRTRTEILQPSSWANGNSIARTGLFDPSPYVQHASGMYDFLAPSARNSPAMRAGAMMQSAHGLPAASSNGSADEALTPVMTTNQGWYSNEWGEDPQKTAEALADFSNQYGDGSHLNLSHYLS